MLIVYIGSIPPPPLDFASLKQKNTYGTGVFLVGEWLEIIQRYRSSSCRFNASNNT